MRFVITLRNITFLAFRLFALSTAVLLGLAQSAPAQSPTPTGCSHCTEIFPANKPINDLGQETYYPTGSPSPSPSTTPVQGGLYPGGFNQRPIAHNNRGIRIAQTKIVPRKRDGSPDPDGTDPQSKIVMISIGMCNTSKEFGGNLGVDEEQGFEWRVMQDFFASLWRNPKLVVIDCAQSEMGANKWAHPINLDPWVELESRLHDARVTRKQVQIIWLKQALAQPANWGVWPTHAKNLQGFLETILNRLVDRNFAYALKNVQMVFLSSRTRAWTLDDEGYHHSPEPYAYETGFAAKWLIEEQINPGVQGWPWLSWGPYIWTDGMNERSDHFTWLCSDVVRDCMHPSNDGVRKVSDQLLAFFKTDPVARPWFLKTPDHPPTNVNVTIDDDDGTIDAGTTVNFQASATPYGTRTIAEYVWTYDDGDYAYGQDVTKAFPASSQSGNPYNVHLTVIDNEGDAAFQDKLITVNPTPTLTPTPTP